MFNYLKSLFVSKSYPLGALLNPVDVRDIHISSVQSPVVIPKTFKSEVAYLEVDNQLSHGTCVAQAISKLKEMYQRQNGIVAKQSARSLYIRTKLVDGLPNTQGTYPRSGANTIKNEGIAFDVDVPDDNSLSYNDYMSFKITKDILTKMKGNTLPGYVAVTPDFESIKQAIYQNGAVTGSLPVDYNWFMGIIKKVTKDIGYHYTLWYGYDEEGIFARNSWGKEWGDNGNFYFKWVDYADTAQDIIAFTNIPKNLMEETKAKKFQFTKAMKFGERSNDVLELQKRLDEEGVYPITLAKTGYYGLGTAEAVYKYQIKNNVAPKSELDALMGNSVGVKTLNALNGGKVSKLDAWCEATKAHEGWYEGSRSFRNKNPGNIRFVGQKTAVGKDSAGFCIFPSYEVGYNELRNMFIRVCTGKSAYYNPEMSLLDFYSVYAPSSDGNYPKQYSAYVAKRLGVDITTKIKTLI